MGDNNLFYTNAAAIKVLFSDLQIEFSLKSLNPDGTLYDLCSPLTVSMSPQHAKIMLNTLQECITQYESAFGMIKIPETSMDGNK